MELTSFIVLLSVLYLYFLRLYKFNPAKRLIVSANKPQKIDFQFFINMKRIFINQQRACKMRI